MDSGDTPLHEAAAWNEDPAVVPEEIGADGGGNDIAEALRRKRVANGDAAYKAGPVYQETVR